MVSLDPAALRRIRRARDITQAELASTLGLSDSSRISAWENGVDAPHINTLARAAAALAVPVADLLTPTDGPHRDLRRLRLEAGLTIAELAHAVQVSPSSLRRLETGQATSQPTSAFIDSLAEALGVTTQVVDQALAIHN